MKILQLTGLSACHPAGLALAGGLLLVAPFMVAAEGADQNSPEEVTVIGQRLANQRAIDAKRNSDRIVDSIATDDLANLPDFSLSEALRRVVGLSTTDRNGDAEFVTVRGLRSDLNFLTIDGARLPSTSNGRTAGNASRGTQMSIVPASLVKRVDVVKSFTANLDANVIGGAFDLKTRSAFDQPDTFFTASLSLGFYQNDKGPEKNDTPYRARLAFADAFGADDQFGVVWASSLSLEDYYTALPGEAYPLWDRNDGRGRRFSNPATAPASTPLVTSGMQAYNYRVERKRQSHYVKFEYQPNNDLYLALFGYKFDEFDSEKRWDTILFRNERDRPRPTGPVSGAVDRARAMIQYYEFGPKIDTKSAGLRLEWAPDDRPHKVDFLLSGSMAKNNEVVTQRRFQTGFSPGLSYRYGMADGFPSLTLDNPAFYNDLGNYKAVLRRNWLNGNDHDTLETRLDYQFEVNDAYTLDTGVGYRREKRVVDYFFLDYRPNSRRTRDLTCAQAALGHTELSRPDMLNGAPLHFMDGAAFDKFFRRTFAEWRSSGNAADRAIQNDYQIKEAVISAYLMGSYQGERLYGSLGLRFEQTDIEAGGYVRVNRVYGFQTVPQDYNNLLPSLSLSYDLTDQSKLRLTWSQTIGRADYFALRPNGSRTVDDTRLTVSASQGNPLLQPRESQNFDLSYEYYTDDGEGAFSIGLFHKRIKNEIFTETNTFSEIINGQPYTVTARRPENAQSARLTGVELGWRMGTLESWSPLLKDLGFNMNYAFIDGAATVLMSDGTSRDIDGLVRQPGNIFNFSLTYSPGNFSATAAYKYRDKNRVSVQTNPNNLWREEYYDTRQSLDFKFRYDWTDSLSMFGEARNVTSTAQDRIVSYNDLIRWRRDYGRSFWVGLTYSLN